MDQHPQVIVTINNGITAEHQDRFEERVFAWFDRLARNADEMSEQLNTKLSELQAEVGDIGQSFADLHAALTTFQSDQDQAVVTLRTDRNRLPAEGTADKATITALTDAIDAHDAAMSAAVDRIGKIIGEAHAVDTNVDAATDRDDGEPTTTTTTTEAPPFPEAGEGERS